MDGHALTVTVVAAAVLGVSAALKLPDNACRLGGYLEVYSSPGRLPVTAAQCNRVYKKEDWQEIPFIRNLAAKPCWNYTLFMLDPDAPDRPPGVYFMHYLFTTSGSCLMSGDMSGTKVLCPYKGPAPPKGTGLHRYMFFLLRLAPHSNPLQLTVDENERPFFNMTAYIEKAAIDGVEFLPPTDGVQFLSAFKYLKKE